MIYNLDILLPLDTLGVLPVLLFLVSGSTPGRLIFCQSEYSCKSGIVLPVGLPVLLFLVSGSTAGRLIFCQWEYSRKSGIVLPGVLPKRLFLYPGSDLDMIYNLDILLPLDTLGVLPVLLFLVSGSTPRRLINIYHVKITPSVQK